jgi:hypothetical protein
MKMDQNDWQRWAPSFLSVAATLIVGGLSLFGQAAWVIGTIALAVGFGIGILMRKLQ